MLPTALLHLLEKKLPAMQLLLNMTPVRTISRAKNQIKLASSVSLDAQQTGKIARGANSLLDGRLDVLLPGPDAPELPASGLARPLAVQCCDGEDGRLQLDQER